MTSLPPRFRWSCLVTLPLLAALLLAASDPQPGPKVHPLVWDAAQQTLAAKPGETSVMFQFSVTNKSEAAVTVSDIHTSCGCTVAEMPASPWVIAPGAKGVFNATVDVQGKVGTLSKSLFVSSSAGPQRLEVTVTIPVEEGTRRAVNQELARTDRQAIFRGDCASCHVAPAVGKSGSELFRAACAICHLAEHRASMVPDLTQPRTKRDAAFWRTWIADGKPETLMPGFAQKHGGPLTAEQIESLVEFALAHLPQEPPSN